MTCRLMESFGIDSLANMVLGGRWDANNVSAGNSISIAANAGPFGTGDFALDCNATTNMQGSASLTKNINVNLAEVYVASYFQLVSAAATPGGIFQFYDGGTLQLTLTTGTGAQFIVKRGNANTGTTLATSAYSAPVGTYIFLEMYALFNSSTGKVQVRVGGSDVISLTTGLNTSASGAGQYSVFHLGPDATGAAAVGPHYKFAHLHLLDTNGSVNNTFLGPKRVSVFRPSGAGTFTQFTPLAGSNWSEVNANPSTGDSSYNASTAVSQKDTFAHAAASGLINIAAVQGSAICRIDNAGPDTGQIVFYDGTTEVDAPSSAPSILTTYSWIEAIQELGLTSGVPFTNSDITALQTGYKLAS